MVRLDFQTSYAANNTNAAQLKFSFQSGSIRLSDLCAAVALWRSGMRFHSKLVRLDFQTLSNTNFVVSPDILFSFQAGSIRLSDNVYSAAKALPGILFSFQAGSIRLSDALTLSG